MSAMNQSKCLIVLGMHRSGTSSVAGALCKLGGSAPRTLYQAADNPKGHWESEAIFRLNDRILESLGSSWADWRAVPDAFAASPAGRAFATEAAGLFKAEYGDGPLPVLKDPRICRLMPFWAEVMSGLGYATHVVMPLRPPLDAAKSLEKRNGIPLVVGVHLWLRHVLDAERATRGDRRTIFTWAAFLDDWRQVTRHIADDAEIVWPRGDAQAAADVDDFLSKDLRNHDSAAEELAHHPGVHAWALDAYRIMMDLPAGPRPEMFEQLDRIGTLFDETSDMFGQFAAAYERTNHLAVERDALRRQVETLTASIRVYEASNADFKGLTERYTAEIGEHWSARGRLDEENRQLLQRVKDLGESVATYEASNNDYKALNERYAGEIAEHWSVRTELETRALQLVQQVRDLTESAAAYETSNNEYKVLSERYAAEIVEHWSTRGRLEAETSQLSQKLTDLADSVAVYETSNSDYKALNERYAAEIAEHWSTRGRLEAEASQLSQRLTDLADSVAAYETSNSDYKALTDRYAAEITAHWAIRGQLEGEKQRLEQAMDEHREQAERSAREAAELRSVQLALEDERRQRERAIEELTSRAASQAGLIDAHAGRIRRLEAEASQLDGELAAARAEIARLEAAAGNLRDCLTAVEHVLSKPVGRLARRIHG